MGRSEVMWGSTFGTISQVSLAFLGTTLFWTRPPFVIPLPLVVFLLAWVSLNQSHIAYFDQLFLESLTSSNAIQEFCIIESGGVQRNFSRFRSQRKNFFLVVRHFATCADVPETKSRCLLAVVIRTMIYKMQHRIEICMGCTTRKKSWHVHQSWQAWWCCKLQIVNCYR